MIAPPEPPSAALHRMSVDSEVGPLAIEDGPPPVRAIEDAPLLVRAPHEDDSCGRDVPPLARLGITVCQPISSALVSRLRVGKVRCQRTPECTCWLASTISTVTPCLRSR